ncbi:MAG: ferrous iron transport protein A [Bdellovibrionales bacterium]|nr:ferrous iron transport protein A [Bdellovibrionales bacterium]
MAYFLELNKNFVISSVSGDENIKTRLIELGFISGHSFKIIEQLSFGDPFIVEVQGTTVALRKKELECIQIQK